MNTITEKQIREFVKTHRYSVSGSHRDGRLTHDHRQLLDNDHLPSNQESPLHMTLKNSVLENPYPPRETSDEIEKVREALSHLDPDSPRGNGIDPNNGYWLLVIWAVASLGWDSTKKIVREWSQRSMKYDAEVFEKTYNSYNTDHSRPIRIGTLYKLASEAEYEPISHHKYTTERHADSINLSDRKNGHLMAIKFSKSLLSIRDTPRWIKWHEGVGWKDAKSDVPMQAAKMVLDDMRQQAARALSEGRGEAEALKRETTRTSKAPSMSAMIKLCKSEPGMAKDLSELDCDQHLLGVENGVLNLTTMNLIAPDPSVLVVKRANVAFDPMADAPRFRQFLVEIAPDAELRAFMVRVLAYLLTGSIKEHCWFFFVGEGRNGKSILMRIMENLLGEYSKKINIDMLMKSGPKQQGSPSPETLQLQGKRFVYANETTEGQRLDDAKIKDMTGGDTMIGRALYSNHFVSFNPSHKLIIAGNNHPIVHDDSHGFWERVVVFPFDVTFTEDQIDKNLEEKLLTEAPGILNVLLEGMHDYLDNGLNIPTVLKTAVQDYRHDQDYIRQFIMENCEIGVDYQQSKKICFLEYQNWCKENGIYPLSANRFSRKLTNRGFKVMDDQRTWLGLKLLSADGQTSTVSLDDFPF